MTDKKGEFEKIVDEDEMLPQQKTADGTPYRDFQVLCYLPTEDEKKGRSHVEFDMNTASLHKAEIYLSSKGFKNWEEYATSLAANIVTEISEGLAVEISTLNQLLPEWSANIATNFTAIQESNDACDLFGLGKDKRAVCIGAGPSIFKNDHLKKLKEALKDKSNDLLVVATDKMIRPLIEKYGIIPDICVTIDSSLRILPFYNNKPVRRNIKNTKFYFCVTTHPKIVRLIKKNSGDMYFHIPYASPQFAPNVNLVYEQMLGNSIVNSAGHCGGAAYFAAGLAGCKTTSLIGYDLSYPGDMNRVATCYYKAIYEKCNGDEDKIGKFFHHYDHDCWNKKERSWVDVVFQSYLSTTMFAIAGQKDDILTLNCTESGPLCAKLLPDKKINMKCITFNDFLEKKY